MLTQPLFLDTCIIISRAFFIENLPSKVNNPFNKHAFLSYYFFENNTHIHKISRKIKIEIESYLKRLKIIFDVLTPWIKTGKTNLSSLMRLSDRDKTWTQEVYKKLIKIPKTEAIKLIVEIRFIIENTVNYLLEEKIDQKIPEMMDYNVKRDLQPYIHNSDDCIVLAQVIHYYNNCNALNFITLDKNDFGVVSTLSFSYSLPTVYFLRDLNFS
jgi:hypothetical protein